MWESWRSPQRCKRCPRRLNLLINPMRTNLLSITTQYTCNEHKLSLTTVKFLLTLKHKSQNPHLIFRALRGLVSCRLSDLIHLSPGPAALASLLVLQYTKHGPFFALLNLLVPVAQKHCPTRYVYDLLPFFLQVCVQISLSQGGLQMISSNTDPPTCLCPCKPSPSVLQLALLPHNTNHYLRVYYRFVDCLLGFPHHSMNS